MISLNLRDELLLDKLAGRIEAEQKMKAADKQGLIDYIRSEVDKYKPFDGMTDEEIDALSEEDLYKVRCYMDGAVAQMKKYVYSCGFSDDDFNECWNEVVSHD